MPQVTRRVFGDQSVRRIVRRHPAVTLIALLGAAAVFFGGEALGMREIALARLVGAPAAPLRITSPVDSSRVGDGDLILIEGTAVDPIEGDADPVEIAFDDSPTWTAADPSDGATGKWRYVWANPSIGLHRIRARSIADSGAPRWEESVLVRVDDTWSSSLMIDDPYGAAGSYRKGQLHMHTTGSFDGWNSLSPAEDALEYKRRGYQFVVITDHDTLSYPMDVNDAAFIAIPGFESTSEKGHITGSFTTRTVAPDLPAQQRLDAIAASGGLAILAHPDWQVGWTSTDFRNLRGYFAFEIFNGITTTSDAREKANELLWNDILNSRGERNPVWAVAVDDSHRPSDIDKGWVMVKATELSEGAIKRSLQRGAFYASNGPSFRVLGVLQSAITASSPDAALIRFINQDGVVVSEKPGAWAAYQPAGSERWIRIEAVTSDGRMAWSQPFWVKPNLARSEARQVGSS